jgi:hypothetical protein
MTSNSLTIQETPIYTGNPVQDLLHHQKRLRDDRKRKAAMRVRQEMPVVNRALDDITPPDEEHCTSIRGYRVSFARKARKKQVDQQFHDHLFSKTIGAGDRPLSMREIGLQVCLKYRHLGNADVSDIASRKNTKFLKLVRQETWYRCERETSFMKANVQNQWNRHLSSVIRAIQQYKKLQLAKAGKGPVPADMQWVPLDLIIPLEEGEGSD